MELIIPLIQFGIFIIALVAAIYVWEGIRDRRKEYSRNTNPSHNSAFLDGTKIVTDFSEKTATPEKYPYSSRASILTPNEHNFFNSVQPLVAPHWHLFTKVRMEDIIEVNSGLEKKEAYGYRSRIKSRHIDFVICDRDTLEILMCIELDDRSHNTKKAKEADAFKDKALKDAGVTLIRIPASSAYSDTYIKGYIFEDVVNLDELADVSAPVSESITASITEDPHARWRPPPS